MHHLYSRQSFQFQFRDSRKSSSARLASIESSSARLVAPNRIQNQSPGMRFSALFRHRATLSGTLAQCAPQACLGKHLAPAYRALSLVEQSDRRRIISRQAEMANASSRRFMWGFYGGGSRNASHPAKLWLSMTFSPIAHGFGFVRVKWNRRLPLI